MWPGMQEEILKSFWASSGYLIFLKMKQVMLYFQIILQLFIYPVKLYLNLDYLLIKEIYPRFYTQGLHLTN